LRVAWNWISIIDPLVTLVLATGVCVAIWRRSARPAGAALLACAAYVAAGAVQQARAFEVQTRLAVTRGHEIQRSAVFPGFANNLIWRSLYRAGDTLHVDRLRVPWWGEPTWSPGYSVALVGEHDLAASVRADGRLLGDFRRFAWFANGWVARAPAEPDIIGDARYSSSSVRFEPVWGIRFLSDAASAPIAWVDRSRQRRVDMRALWHEVAGRDPAARPLPAPPTSEPP